MFFTNNLQISNGLYELLYAELVWIEFDNVFLLLNLIYS